MKCVKAVKQQKNVKIGDIIRTTDEDATEKVRGGMWEYAKKEEWKSSTRKEIVKQPEISDETPKIKKGKTKKELKLEKKQNK